MRVFSNNPRRQEAGYSLLMLVFMVASMLIVAATVTPNLLTQGRRERETETIWRGEQYARAVGLYFRKFGKYPTKIEDLTRQTNGVRFLRQAYTDPTNKDDGTWRFIYVGPNGQLIGSVSNISLVQNAVSAAAPSVGSVFGGGLIPPPSSVGASAGPNSGANPNGAQGPGGQQSPDGTQTTGAQQTPGGQQTAAGGPQTPGGQQATGFGTDLSQSQPQPLGGTIMGGNIIGVGCKSKEASLRVYKKGDTYNKWEFIWNPLQQTMITGQPAQVNPGGAAGQQPGQQALPNGSNPQAPTSGLPPTSQSLLTQ